MELYNPYQLGESKVNGPGSFFMRLCILGLSKKQLDEIISCLNIAYNEGLRQKENDIKKVLNI